SCANADRVASAAAAAVEPRIKLRRSILSSVIVPRARGRLLRERRDANENRRRRTEDRRRMTADRWKQPRLSVLCRLSSVIRIEEISMPAYWVARSRIIDPVEYKKYTDPLPAIFANYDAKILARGGRYQIME